MSMHVTNCTRCSFNDSRGVRVPPATVFLVSKYPALVHKSSSLGSCTIRTEVVKFKQKEQYVLWLLKTSDAHVTFRSCATLMQEDRCIDIMYATC